MLEQLVEQLGGLQLGSEVERDSQDHRLEDPGQPLVGDELFVVAEP